MRWHDLLFMHWPLSAAALRERVPPSLELDTFERQAWIGVVPFYMTGVRPRYLPALPWLSSFPELNVRTYVTRNGKPGVWFFSLDAGNPVAVWAARRFFHLPYYHARMSIDSSEGDVHYRCARAHRKSPPAFYSARYRPRGESYRSARGSLEHWLTERYRLYAVDHRGAPWCGEIHHPPWPLQPAECEVAANTMVEPLGLELPDTEPLLHFAKRLDVVAWRLEKA